ncbi:MAG: hypothetical protein ABJN95_09495 [Maribacter sp.]
MSNGADMEVFGLSLWVVDSTFFDRVLVRNPLPIEVHKKSTALAVPVHQ